MIRSRSQVKEDEGGDVSMNVDNDDLVEHEAKDYTNVGPPGFYEDDIQKYYAKFDESRRERHEFK